MSLAATTGGEASPRAEREALAQAERARWEGWWRYRCARSGVARLYLVVADGAGLVAADASRAAYEERYGAGMAERVVRGSTAHVLDVLVTLLGLPLPRSYNVPTPTDACGGDGACDGSCARVGSIDAAASHWLAREDGVRDAADMAAMAAAARRAAAGVGITRDELRKRIDRERLP